MLFVLFPVSVTVLFVLTFTLERSHATTHCMIVCYFSWLTSYISYNIKVQVH